MNYISTYCITISFPELKTKNILTDLGTVIVSVILYSFYLFSTSEKDLRKTAAQPIQCKDMCPMYFSVTWQMVTDDKVTRTDASA